VLYAPLGFFLQNPVGEMLVAFTKDQDIIDENLVDTLHYLGIYGLIMLSTVITVSVTIPMFSVFGGVLFFVTGVMLYFYLPAATTLKKQKTETAGECNSLCSAGIADRSCSSSKPCPDCFLMLDGLVGCCVPGPC
jgi:ABC-type multidrug transport system fused ATPase/permease subunit